MREAKTGRTSLHLAWLLLAALLVAAMATMTPLQAATGNEDPANATDLGNWDTATSGQRTNEQLFNTDRVNYYKFTLTAERSLRIYAVNQDTERALLTIRDEDENILFYSNARGSQGSGSDQIFHDEIRWQVYGPGTWYIRMGQPTGTRNRYDLKWEGENAPVIPGDDYAAGIWSDGTVSVGNSISPGYSTDGSITSPSDSVRDNDWLKVVIPTRGKYEIRAVPRGNNGTRPLMLLRDRYGQASSELFDSEGHLRRNLKAGTYFVELRGSNGLYWLGVRTGWTPPGSEPFMGDLKQNNDTRGWVKPNRWQPTGHYEHASDIDYFKVELTAGKKYRISVQGAVSGRGTAGDPVIYLAGSSGVYLPPETNRVEVITGDISEYIADDDSGTSLDAKLEIRVNTGGTYYIATEEASGDAGTYRVKVTTFE